MLFCNPYFLFILLFNKTTNSLLLLSRSAYKSFVFNILVKLSYLHFLILLLIYLNESWSSSDITYHPINVSVYLFHYHPDRSSSHCNLNTSPKRKHVTSSVVSSESWEIPPIEITDVEQHGFYRASQLPPSSISGPQNIWRHLSCLALAF